MASSCLTPIMAIENFEVTTKPNWLELPRDITMNILQRLGTLEIVTAASVVCPLWWNICKEPLMWSTIDMITGVALDIKEDSYIEYYARLEKICRYAVDRSCGHLKDIYIKKFGTNDLLIHIAESASHLRSIRLENCYDIPTGTFNEVVKNQPFLEELHIFHCFYYDQNTNFFEFIGQSCPLLKSLKFLPTTTMVVDDKSDNEAFDIAKTMPMLQQLTILNNGLTNNGLLAILDGCPLLESLDIRGCLHLDLDGILNERCMQIKELRLPSDFIDSWNFQDLVIHVQMQLSGFMDNFDISIVEKLKEIND